MPRILTDDGHLIEDGAAGPPAAATAADRVGGNSTASGRLHKVPVAGVLTWAPQAEVTAAPAGDTSDDALRVAKQRALALANALSGAPKQPPGPTHSAVTAAASAETAAATGAVPETGAMDPAVEASPLPLAAVSPRPALPEDVHLPQLQKAGRPAEVSGSPDGPEGAALARLLSDYVDADDDE